ncbi:hypothetical protein A1O1_06172 [Capronia coronata CBS 617.96]|uniref:Uncharacterized protein n=1 Tax=Capronia coronata CBS 617.96 TaxID=1182541 RepID=W9XZZ5_9EURO|nr:uncharacterized protein A1O1_06172 [Capronia coronata CBS 617.96]EXJ85803.1 hypothetical protein A1O1_06172 [Capronia coronata CBS 617.96]
MPVFSITFTNELNSPLKYDWGRNVYKACPDCIRAHEVRTCDGETKVTFAMCETHAPICDKNYEKALLSQIRNMIYPLYSCVPLPDVSREELWKTVSVNPLPAATFIKSATSPFHYTIVPPTLPKTPPPLPHPIVEYTHAKGCSRSDKPDVVAKSAEEVFLMDKFANERLQTIKGMLAGGLEAIMDDNLRYARDMVLDHVKQDLKEKHELRRRAKLRAKRAAGEDEDKGDGDDHAFESRFALALATLTGVPPATDSGLMSGSGGDNSDLDDANGVQLTEEIRNHHLWQLFEVDARKFLVQELNRLEPLVAMGPLTKATYVKRCNGEYRNGVGDILIKNDLVIGTGSFSSADASTADTAGDTQISAGATDSTATTGTTPSASTTGSALSASTPTESSSGGGSGSIDVGGSIDAGTDVGIGLGLGDDVSSAVSSQWAPISAKTPGYAIVKRFLDTGELDPSADILHNPLPRTEPAPSASSDEFWANLGPPITSFPFRTDLLVTLDKDLADGKMDARTHCSRCWDNNRFARKTALRTKELRMKMTDVQKQDQKQDQEQDQDPE